MPTYRVTDPQTGKTLRLTGDSPPTEQELTAVFSSVGGGDKPPGIEQSPVYQQIAQRASVGTGPEWSARYPNLYGLYGVAQEFGKLGMESAGLIGGGTLGAPLGIPGIVAGAGMGYGVAKNVENIIEGKRKTIPQAVVSTGQDIASGAAMEMGGQLVGRGVKAGMDWLKRPTTTTVPENIINERLDLARKQGIELTPAEATGSKGLALYESMLDKSPFSTSVINSMREFKQLKPLIALREKLIEGGGKAEQIEVLGQKIQDEVNAFIGQYKAMNEAQMNTLRDNVLSKLGSAENFETLGKRAQDAIAERSKGVYAKAGELYSGIGDLIPEGTMIRPERMRAVAEKILAEESKKPPSLQNSNVQKILRDLSGTDDALMQEINAYPEAARDQILAKVKAEGTGGYDWKTIQSIRSELNSRIAQADAAIRSAQPGAKFQSTPEAGVYKALRKELDRDIEEFSGNIGGEVKESFDLANAFYKEGKQVYNSDTIRRIIGTNPEKVVDAVFKPRGGYEIDAVRNAIGQDAFNNTVKPAVTKRLLGEGAFNPKELASKLKTYGDDVLLKVYSPEELKMVKGLATDGRIQMEGTLAGSRILKTISNERPEVIVDSILGSYERFPGSTTVLRNTNVIRSVVSKDTFASLQREMSDRIFRLNQITGQVQPERLAKTLQTYDRVLERFYSPEQVAWLRDVAKTGKLMAAAERQAANPSGTAQNVVTWGTWGAMLRNPISGAFTGIIAPTAMAKLYLSPAGRRYFLNAMSTPANSGQGAALFTKLMSIVGTDIVNKNEARK